MPTHRRETTSKQSKKPEPLRIRPDDYGTLEEALNRGNTLPAKVLRRVKGGLIVQVANTPAFLPSSLVDTRTVYDTEKYVGKTLDVQLVRLSPEAGVLTVSRRSVIELQMGQERMKLLDSLKVGGRLEGIVCSLTDFGAFVDIGGLHGLIPLSAWSAKPGTHPSQFVSPGQMVKVIIKALSKDVGRTRITLSKPLAA